MKLKFNGATKAITVTIMLAIVSGVFAYGIWRGSKTECDLRQDKAIDEIKLDQKDLRKCYTDVLVEQKYTNKILEDAYPKSARKARKEIHSDSDTLQ